MLIVKTVPLVVLERSIGKTIQVRHKVACPATKLIFVIFKL